jgi:hypothetical protein
MKIIDNQSILLDIYQEYRLPPGLFYGNTGLGIVLLLSRQLSCDDFFGKSILEKLNNRPRKKNGFRKPKGMIKEKIA